MKTPLLLPLLLVLMISVTGCNTVKGIFGKNAKAETRQAVKVDQVQKAQAQNTTDKMEQVAVLASGTDYALNKVTNKEPSVFVAQDINKRVISLAGKPDIDAEKEMWATVDDLLSQNSDLRKKGLKMMNEKDEEIQKLQENSKQLAADKDVEINKYMQLAQSTALKADTQKAELDDYKGWFGLKAVFKGLGQFVRTAFWTLVIGGILFIALRFASMANPVAAAVFGVFEQVVAGVLKGVEVLFPKALNFAGTVSKATFNQSQALLKKIVDNIQNLKDYQTKAGHDITLKEILVEFDKSLNADEKALIDKIKKELGYN